MLDPKLKYVSLVTFRKSGDSVATPVWFADLGGSIRNNSRVTITPCDMRGAHLDRATTLPATARIVSGDDATKVRKAIRRKYPLTYRLLAVMWHAQVLVEKLKRVPQDPEVAIVFTLD